MKYLKIIVVIIMLSAANSGKSQLAYLGIGYNMNRTNPEGLNVVVNRYNQIRNNLDKELGDFKSLGGMTIHAGGTVGHFLFGFDYSWRRNVNSAKGVFNNQSFKRELQFREDKLGLNVGIAAGEKTTAVLTGIKFDFYMPRVFTRLESDASPDPEWSKANTSVISSRIGPFIKLCFGPKAMWPAGFFIELNYGFGLFKTKYHEVDEAINGADYTDFEIPKELMTRSNYFGFHFGYGINLIGN